MRLEGLWVESGERVAISVEGQRVAGVETLDSAGKGGSLPWLLPGLVDLQVNGFGGVEFSDALLTPQQVAGVAEAVSRGGATRFCPTLTTNSFEALAAGMRAIARACEADPRLARRIAGVHLEGPYLSPHEGPRGAHPAAHVRPPDWEEFARLQDAAGGRIRLVTLSAEYERSPEFIRRAAGAGVVAALGHQRATSAQIRAAVDAGARLSTHLGNGCDGSLPRHPNYLWDQMAEDRLLASLIVDGHHLPPAVVKSIVRAKGAERIVLVSDLAGSAGLPPGRYETSGGPVEVLPEGRIVVAGQTKYLAGASLPLVDCLSNVVAFAGVPWSEAVPMATTRPAELIGIVPARLAVGAPADFTVCRPTVEGRMSVAETIVSGEVV